MPGVTSVSIANDETTRLIFGKTVSGTLISRGGVEIDRVLTSVARTMASPEEVNVCDTDESPLVVAVPPSPKSHVTSTPSLTPSSPLTSNVTLKGLMPSVALGVTSASDKELPGGT